MWKELQDKNGRLYYYDTETKKTTWDKPVELADEKDRLLAAHKWKMLYAQQSKRYYYYNLETKETTWDFPVKIEKVPTEDAKPEAKTDESKTQSTDVDEIEETPQNETDTAYYDIFKLQTNPESATATIDGPAAKERLIELFDNNSVDTSWSFEKVMTTLVEEPDYWLIRDPLLKKQIFEEYLLEKSKKEVLEISNAREKFQENFQRLLEENSDKIHYYSRWKTVKSLIGDEPVFTHSILSESEKRKMFESYVAGLRQAHEASEQKLKEQALSEFTSYFESIVKKNPAQFFKDNDWHKFIQFIENDKRVEQNKNLKRLDKLDMLRVYMNAYKKFEKSVKEEIEAFDQENYKSDARHRASFKKLLQDMKSEDLITVNTSFNELFPYIENEEAFLSLLGRNGSKPIEIFWDIVEEESMLLKAQKDMVLNYLLDNEKLFNILRDSKAKFLEIIENAANEKKFVTSDTEFLLENIESIYETLLRQTLTDLKKKKLTAEKRLQEEESKFVLNLSKYLRNQHLMSGKSLDSVTWDSFGQTLKQTDTYSQFKVFIQKNYKLLFDDVYAKLLDWDNFVKETQFDGSSVLASLEDLSQEPEEKLVKLLMEKAVYKLKNEMAEEKSAVTSSSMDLDY